MRHAFSFFYFPLGFGIRFGLCFGIRFGFPSARRSNVPRFARSAFPFFCFLRICIFGVLAAFLPERVRVPSKKACR